MSVRRMNYTRRIELDRRSVEIRLGTPDRSGVRTFDVNLLLPSGLPESALVYVEAHRGSPPARMRFDLGTVGRIRELSGDERRLSEFQVGLPDPIFRVKVVSAEVPAGRLLADARQVRALNAEDRRQGILHIHHKDLEGLAWELDVLNTGYEPTLWIDEQADPAMDLARDPKFVALVYPEVLRGVLTYLLIDADATGIDDVDEWGSAWYRLACGLPQMIGDDCPLSSDHDEADARREWIGRAVRAFASKSDVRDLLTRAKEIES